MPLQGEDSEEEVLAGSCWPQSSVGGATMLNLGV